MVWFESATRSRWIGVFRAGLGGESTPTGVVALPDCQTVLVVNRGAAYWVDVDEPLEVELLSRGELTQAVVADELNMVILADFTRARAYGASGQLWATQRLAWDDLRLLGVWDGRFVAEGFDAPAGRMATFTLDPVTGAADGAPFVEV